MVVYYTLLMTACCQLGWGETLWGWMSRKRLNCVAQEQNTVILASTRTQTARTGSFGQRAGKQNIALKHFRSKFSRPRISFFRLIVRSRKHWPRTLILTPFRFISDKQQEAYECSHLSTFTDTAQAYRDGLFNFRQIWSIPHDVSTIDNRNEDRPIGIPDDVRIDCVSFFPNVVDRGRHGGEQWKGISREKD